MRYVYKEPIISTISDENITDENVINDLLKNIQEQQYSIYMEYADMDNCDITKKIDNVRIKSISETSIDVHIFFKTATAIIRNIPIKNIQEIKLIAPKQLLAKKHKVKQWYYVDIAELD